MEDAKQARDEIHALFHDMMPLVTEPGPELAEVRDASVPVMEEEIPVRVYRPTVDRPLPACIFIHGGGFWQGNLAIVDSECRFLAAESGCVVVSVGYRLAPEYPFPTPLEDCYTALCWTVEHAEELGIDAERVAISGGSAGGNLAAAVTLLARDRGGPSLKAQVLVVPVTDLTMSQPSMDEFAEGYGFTREHMRFCAKAYLGHDGIPENPLISPLFADLHGLPPALIVTAEFDPLRDDGEAYGRRLREAGAPTTIQRISGMLHGSFLYRKLVPEVAEAYNHDIAAFLIDAFRGVRTETVGAMRE